MKKKIKYSTVLGIHDKIFSLIKGEEIEIFDTDKYGRVEVMIQNQKVLVNRNTIGRFI